jgi:hypothetical protein
MQGSKKEIPINVHKAKPQANISAPLSNEIFRRFAGIKNLFKDNDDLLNKES